MKTSSLRAQIYLLRCPNLSNSTANPSFLIPIKTTSYLIKQTINASSSHEPTRITAISRQTLGYPGKTQILENGTPKSQKPSKQELYQNGYSRFVLLGAVSMGFVLLLMGMDGQKALAFGPEGPLVEEFWDNVRRYGLYALTVSTGAIYTILLPILELLKNPISAILILTIIGGSIFIVSQVLSAMVGVTDFAYDYGY